MFKKILLPLDLTDKHQPALDIAAELAGHSAGEVVLLHVIEVIPGLEADEEREFYDRLERSAREHLNRLSGVLANRHIRPRIAVVYGNRPREIVRYATEMGADLILAMAPRIDADNPTAGWGSLSWKLGLLAPCAVLLVK